MRPDYLQSSDAETDNFLLRIYEKAMRLKKNDVTYSDRDILKTRLQIAWGEAAQAPNATAWRRNRAREIYTQIEDASEHLFLSVLLAITPTECAKKCFNDTIDCLLRIGSYEWFLLSPGPTTKTFFETTAVELGFTGHRRYLDFMLALFPSAETRQIQFAYSNIPLDKIDLWFDVIRKGIQTSKQWTEERQRGEDRTSSLTAVVPTGDKDCTYTVIIGREDMMESLRQLGLTQFKFS